MGNNRGEHEFGAGAVGNQLSERQGIFCVLAAIMADENAGEFGHDPMITPEPPGRKGGNH